MRRSFLLIIGLALVAAACAPQDLTREGTNTVSSIQAPPASSTTTTTETPHPVPLDTSDEDPDGIAWLHREWSTPDGVDPYDAVWGDTGMVVLGYQTVGRDDSPTPNGLWFFDGETWSGTMLSDVTMPDEYGFTPLVTELVWFGGRYLAFLMGDATTTPGRASMLASDDGVDWDLEYLGVAPVAALPAGLYATPESPPWPGTSAITKAAIHAGEITAVGWTVLASGESYLSLPVVWRSTDGHNWSTKTLPNANFDNEWASDVAVGPLGYLVEVAGPVHQSAFLWHSPDGDNWIYVGDRFEDQWRMLVSLAVGEESLMAVLMDLEDDGGQTLHLWRSFDGLEWEQVETVFPLEISSDGWVRVDLTATEKGIVAVVAGDRTIDLWRSPEGQTWIRLPSIVRPAADAAGQSAPTRTDPSSIDGLSLVATGPGTVMRWIEDDGN